MTLSGTLVTLGIVWLVWRALKWLLTPWWREVSRQVDLGRITDYRLTPERNHWLALCHPMAFSIFSGGLADLENFTLDAAQRQHVRSLTLHHFQLSTQLSDAQAQADMPRQVRSLWFRMDLQHLQPQDDPRDALAFAICRTASFVRIAHWLGWIDAELQWTVLQLNASRAQSCFESWADYGSACLRGRQQWINGGRSDTLGRAHTQEELQDWLQAKWHPWAVWDWRLPSASPLPASALSTAALENTAAQPSEAMPPAVQ